jgi:hypothetical protein
MQAYSATVFLLIPLLSCTNKVYLHRINTYLNAHTIKTRSRYLSEDYHSFFIEKKGEGRDKKAALRSFSNWDAPLRPDITILNHSVNGNEWRVEFNEQNDFSKLIGFAGWKGTEKILFNSKKKTCEVTYIPNDENPDYKNWLQPAVDWLQKNRPGEVDEVYKKGKFVQTPETAKKWVKLLQLWRKQAITTK